jgi:hypothetical protein
MSLFSCSSSVQCFTDLDKCKLKYDFLQLEKLSVWATYMNSYVCAFAVCSSGYPSSPLHVFLLFELWTINMQLLLRQNFYESMKSYWNCCRDFSLSCLKNHSHCIFVDMLETYLLVVLLCNGNKIYMFIKS